MKNKRINQILELLQSDKALLPIDFLQDDDIDQFTAILKDVFAQNKDFILEDELVKSNYIDLVIYVYMRQLRKTPEKRVKNIFPQAMLDHLLETPARA